MLKITAGVYEAGQRLDKFVFKFLDKAPSGFVYRMLRKKNITLNGRKASGKEIISAGDEITFWLSDETVEKFRDYKEESIDENLPEPEIIFENSDVIIMNKRAGDLSQKAGSGDVSINEMMIAHLIRSGKFSREELRHFHPSVCNRLDRNTSGLICGGKTMAGLQFLTEGFRDRSIHKYYICITAGHIACDSKISGYLVKDHRTNRVSISNKETRGSERIETGYRPLGYMKASPDSGVTGEYTILEVALITGRTHQIRAHLAEAGHPLAGDFKYGSDKINRYFRSKYGLRHQLLHAGRLKMPEHIGEIYRGSSGVMELEGREFRAPLPEIFHRIIEGEEIRWLHGIHVD